MGFFYTSLEVSKQSIDGMKLAVSIETGYTHSNFSLYGCTTSLPSTVILPVLATSDTVSSSQFVMSAWFRTIVGVFAGDCASPALPGLEDKGPNIRLSGPCRKDSEVVVFILVLKCVKHGLRRLKSLRTLQSNSVGVATKTLARLTSLTHSLPERAAAILELNFDSKFVVFKKIFK